MKRLARPRRSDGPSSEHTITNASTISAKYSAGPKSEREAHERRAPRATSASVASVPATNDPIAAVESAAPPRPERAI